MMNQTEQTEGQIRLQSCLSENADNFYAKVSGKESKRQDSVKSVERCEQVYSLERKRMKAAKQLKLAK